MIFFDEKMMKMKMKMIVVFREKSARRNLQFKLE
jgi:hypothetical protein